MSEAERTIETPDDPAPAGKPPADAVRAEPVAKHDQRHGEPSPPDAAGAAPSAGEAEAASAAEGATRGERTEAPEGQRADDGAAGDGGVPREAGPGAEGAAEPASAEDGGEPAPPGRRRIAVLASVAAFAYLLDLVTKIIAVEWLEHRAPVEVLGEWLQFRTIRNSGAAFGVGEALTIVFTCIAAAVIVVIVRLARKLYSTPWAVALGLLLGGALGNLTDRLFRAPGALQGAVVDFIAPKAFAVFNLADSAIVCGGILIVILSFRGLDPDGTVHRD